MTGDPNVPAGNHSVVTDADSVTVGRYDGAEAEGLGLSRPIGAHPPSTHNPIHK